MSFKSCVLSRIRVLVILIVCILYRNRRISPERLMVATAGGKKQNGLQRSPARTLFPTSRAQAAVDMPRRATIKPTFLQNFLHSSIPTMENLWASSRVLRTHSWKVIQCLHSLQSPRNWLKTYLFKCSSETSQGHISETTRWIFFFER